MLAKATSDARDRAIAIARQAGSGIGAGMGMGIGCGRQGLVIQPLPGIQLFEGAPKVGIFLSEAPQPVVAIGPRSGPICGPDPS